MIPSAIKKKKKCVICGKEFVRRNYSEKTCSPECSYQNRKNLMKKRSKETVEKTCKKCGKTFVVRKHYISSKLCRECQYKKMSKDRKGKGNPAYRNGTRVNGKHFATSKHGNACKKYRKNFLEIYGFLYCESCDTSNSARFETHHIYYASRFPKHKELHNEKNLILLCIKCHNQFHAEKRKEEFKQLERKRGLKKLFEKGRKKCDQIKH